jgi:hypothetical protein
MAFRVRTACLLIVGALAACSGSVQIHQEGSGSTTGGTPPDEPCASVPDRACYGGPEETLGIGLCRAGVQVCEADGAGYGACNDEVTPHAEVCATSGDESCDGEGACTGALIWAAGGGGTGMHGGADVDVDRSGNVIVTGRVLGALELGGAKLDADDYQAFLVKLDRDGHASWHLVAQGSSAGAAVAADADGNVFVGGSFNGTMELGGKSLTAAGQSDIFLAKLDPTGALVWSKRLGGAFSEWVQEIVIDPAGNLVVIGGFEASTDIGGGSLAAVGETDVFVLGLDSAGNHLFSRSFGSASYDYGIGVAVGAGGEIALAGSFDGAIDLGGGALSSVDEDAFVAVLGPTGDHRWSRRFGGVGHDLAKGVGVDPAGNIVIAGLFSNEVDFGGGPLVAEGDYETFVAKLDSAGNHVYSRRFGGPESAGYAARLAVDGAGNAVAFGLFSGTIVLGGAELTAAGANGASGPEDLFVLKLDPAGSPVWSRQLGSSDRERAYGIGLVATGEVYLTGDFYGTVDFGAGPMTAPVDSWALFLAKLAP